MRTLLRLWFARTRDVFRRNTLDRDLREQIQGHLDEATEDYIHRGLARDAARRLALREFGGVSTTEEAHRDVRSFVLIDRCVRDVRYAGRALRRSVGFSSIVVLVLALGIGALTAVFTLLNRVVLQPLPYPAADRLVTISHDAPGLQRADVGVSSGLYFYYQTRSRSFEAMGLFRETVLNLRSPDAGAERINVAFADPHFFDVMGVVPELGRLFTEADAQPGFLNMTWPIPVLLSHDLWVTKFGQDPAIIDRQITINEMPRHVVGILPPGFAFPRADTQVWMLWEPRRSAAAFAASFGLSVVARLRPGMSPALAQQELALLLPQIVGAFPDATADRVRDARLAPSVVSLKAQLTRGVSRVLWTLFASMFGLLAIACTNVGSLFGIRIEDRRREMAVRQALGAQRRDVVRLFLTEALILTVLATGLGLLLAQLAISAVIGFDAVHLPRREEVQLDRWAILLAALVAGMLSAAYAALSWWRQRRFSLTGDLSGCARHTRVRRAVDPFLILQMALALSLMATSALVLRTYANLVNTPLGFSSGRLLTVEIGLPYREAPNHARIYQTLIDRIRSLREVDSASAASFLPLTASQHMFPVEPNGEPVPFKFVLPDYFETMGTPVVEGTVFRRTESLGRTSPVFVSAALARHLYPTQTAIGRPLYRYGANADPSGNRVAFTIAGVIADVREVSLRRPPSEIVYVPVVEPNVEPTIIPTEMTLIVHTRVGPRAVTPDVRQIVAQVDPSISIAAVRTMDDVVFAAHGMEAFVGTLLLIAAAASLCLGLIGVYGGVSQVVRQRTREIGIRIALGARRSDVLRTVCAGSMVAVALGTAIGVLISLTSSGTLRALLYGVQPHDPALLVEVTLVLVGSALATAMLAAARAAQITPLESMRAD